MASPYRTFVEEFGLSFKEHQEECVDWCIRNEEAERGGLIADEMGLGKTIQILALMHARPTPNTLIVVPLALLDQWEQALGTWTSNGTRIIVYRGATRSKTTLADLQTSICLTTYGEAAKVTRHTNDLHSSGLHKLCWSRVVFDEAHHLRNSRTAAHRGAFLLRSKIKWLLTGTPIQNSFADFQALCAIMRVPTSLYSGSTVDLVSLTKLFIIKRTKRGLAIPMPELQEETIVVDWKDEAEAAVAAQLHSRLGMGEVKDRMPRFRTRLVDYLRARQMCVLPRLLTGEVQEAQAQQQQAQQQQTQQQQQQQGGSDDDEEDIGTLERGITGRSKIDAVIKTIISRRDTGRKLVFCEFKQEIAVLQEALLNHDILAVTLNGGMTKEMRENVIKSPHIDVLVLQIRTCSEGLNLQAYNEIFIVSPNWNPSIEQQAVGRCYRLGQTKDVKVFRFRMDDKSIGLRSNMEGYVMEKQQTKMQIAQLLDEASDK